MTMKHLSKFSKISRIHNKQYGSQLNFFQRYQYCQFIVNNPCNIHNPYINQNKFNLPSNSTNKQHHNYSNYPSQIHHNCNINHNRNNSIFYQSKRYKRSTKKKRQAEEDENRPEIGYTLDTDDIKKKMIKLIAKLQTQLREIQPRTANPGIIENIELTLKNRPKIGKVADVTMRGTTHISILPHESKYNDDIIYALSTFNEHFHPRIEENTGLIVATVPTPNEEQLKHLRDAVSRRGQYCKKECQKTMKVGLNELKRIKEYLSKDDFHAHHESLNALIKSQQAVIDRLVETKLKEFR